MKPETSCGRRNEPVLIRTINKRKRKRYLRPDQHYATHTARHIYIYTHTTNLHNHTIKRSQTRANHEPPKSITTQRNAKLQLKTSQKSHIYNQNSRRRIRTQLPLRQRPEQRRRRLKVEAGCARPARAARGDDGQAEDDEEFGE